MLNVPGKPDPGRAGVASMDDEGFVRKVINRIAGWSPSPFLPLKRQLQDPEDEGVSCPRENGSSSTKIYKDLVRNGI
jgi:hypothetical protein